MPTLDARYLPYSRETALCVDVAYEGLESDLRDELKRASGESTEILRRLLQRLDERRGVLERFKKAG